MTAHDALFAGPETTLESLLDAREGRAARRAGLLAQGGVVIAVSVVMPGPVKSCPLARDAAEAAEAALRAVFAAPERRARRAFAATTAMGPEALWLLDGEARDIKRATMAIEESHPLGRLFDLDVETKDGAVTRASLGAAARSCLVCGAPARGCARSQSHTLAQLRGAMAALHRAWEASR